VSFSEYPAYQECGRGWLEAVPGHWAVARLKQVIGKIESGTSVNASDEPIQNGAIGVLKTSCVYQGFFDPRENKTVVAEDLSRVSCPVSAGTLIVSRMNTPDLIGAAGLVEETLANLFLPDRLWQITLRGAEPRFVYWWTRSQSYRAQVEAACTGTSASMKNLAQEQFASLVLPLPPLAEQRAVALFLERETAKVDALIAEQRRLIQLLQEQRQAVISTTITKGLDSSVRMKASGVDWLGDIPSHWRTTPLKWLTDPDRPIMYGIVLPGPDVGSGVPILKGGNIRPARMNLGAMARTTPEIEAPYARARLREGDLVYSIRGSIGDCEIVPRSLEGSNITQDVARIAVKGACATFVRWALLSAPIREELASGSLGAAVRGVNIFDLKRVVLPTPPPDEQAKIGAYLDGETRQCEQLMREAERAIDLLLERRSAMISAAVTGQIDVRGLAPVEAA
jgi:type I restriction enzyme, S subunit